MPGSVIFSKWRQGCPAHFAFVVVAGLGRDAGGECEMTVTTAALRTRMVCRAQSQVKNGGGTVRGSGVRSVQEAMAQ